jgi:hypothetical protein
MCRARLRLQVKAELADAYEPSNLAFSESNSSCARAPVSSSEWSLSICSTRSPAGARSEAADVDDFFREDVHAEAELIKQALSAWAEQATEQLREARPERLGVRDRMEDALRLRWRSARWRASVGVRGREWRCGNLPGLAQGARCRRRSSCSCRVGLSVSRSTADERNSSSSQ